MQKLKAVFNLLFAHRWHLVFERGKHIDSDAVNCGHTMAKVVCDGIRMLMDHAELSDEDFDVFVKYDKQMLRKLQGNKFREDLYDKQLEAYRADRDLFKHGKSFLNNEMDKFINDMREVIKSRDGDKFDEEAFNKGAEQFRKDMA